MKEHGNNPKHECRVLKDRTPVAAVYELINGKAEPVNADEYIGCETCVEVCPNGACTVTEI